MRRIAPILFCRLADLELTFTNDRPNRSTPAFLSNVRQPSSMKEPGNANQLERAHEMKIADNARRVLHVDDDPDMLRLVRHKLGPHCDITSLNDPSECVNELVRTGCRLVILDIDMGEYNGLDLLRTIKRLDGGIHVIMLTGLVSMQTVLTSMREGAEACLFKPLNDPSDLLSVVNESVKKIERWHESVKDLLKRKRAATNYRDFVPADLVC